MITFVMFLGGVITVVIVLFLFVAIATNREVQAASERIDEWIRQRIDIELTSLIGIVLMLGWLLADAYDRAQNNTDPRITNRTDALYCC